MRADRLLSILLLLQTRGRVTARELSEELEVSERTVLRDMDALTAAGVPVVAQRGASGGWSLMEGYRTELTGLHEHEVQALFVGAPAKLLADLKLDRASDAALLKLLTALPSMFRRGAEYARQRIHIDLAGWKMSREQVPLLPVLQDAVFRERRIVIDYTHGERILDPLGLVAKGNLWYLVAAHDGQPRTYRVSRITRVVPMDEPARRPADFDLATFWQQSMQTFRERLPRFDCVALIDRDAVRSVETFLRYGSIDHVEEHDERRVRATMHFDAIEAAALSLMQPGVTVVEPRELRLEILRIARAVIESAS
ncbi:MAG TPA: WYL domain-containing protein [Thermoanaerobaculia bacterium]|nr:WYL domain-containing protein [Thermoanaerobaculia bacterium]